MSRRLVSKAPQQATLQVRVEGLFLEGPSGFETEATVQVTEIFDKYSDDAVTGVSLPITLEYVSDWESWLDSSGRPVFSTDGNYVGDIPHTNSMQAARYYFATILATSVTGKQQSFREEIEVVHGEA